MFPTPCNVCSRRSNPCVVRWLDVNFKPLILWTLLARWTYSTTWSLPRLHSEISKKSVRVFRLNYAYIFYGYLISLDFTSVPGRIAFIVLSKEVLSGDLVSLIRLFLTVDRSAVGDVAFFLLIISLESRLSMLLSDLISGLDFLVTTLSMSLHEFARVVMSISMLWWAVYIEFNPI